MHLRPTDYVLWFAAPLMQLGVLYAMYKRKLNRDYPYFFNYTVLQVLSFAFLLGVKNFYALYFYGYWVSLALDVVVSFAVLQEIFKDAFRPYEALRDLSVILFRWSALIVLLVAGMWAINSHSSTQVDTITHAIFLADRSVRLMQCGLVFFLLLFSEYLGISRHSAVFGIAVGFGLFAAVQMLVATGMDHPSIVGVTLLRWINSGVYDVSAFIWLCYAMLSAPSRARVPATSYVRTKDWNNALQDARIPMGSDSILDNMETTVERLLYPAEEIHAVAGNKASS